MTPVTIRLVKNNDKPEWLRMRLLLWPDHTAGEMLAEMDEILAQQADLPVFIALKDGLAPCGFLEGGIRKYADGCDTSPVGYIEGWYVDEDIRRQGIGAALVRAMEDWTRARDLTEIASDTWLWNETSISAHKNLGYTEVERLVHFAKKL